MRYSEDRMSKYYLDEPKALSYLETPMHSDGSAERDALKQGEHHV